MKIKEILDNYLQTLQVLQTTVAQSWCDRCYYLMVVNIGHKHMKAEIFQLDEKNRVTDSCSCFVCEGMSAETINERITAINAFFASKCITTAAGVESPICLN